MIKIDSIGRIVSGEEAGRFVRIQELPDDPPSYLIITAVDRDFRQGGGDSWAEDEASLRQYFIESRWIINWEE
ncbi:hypothetical protein GCM10010207_38220 [Streptomyces atratus]|nr:hypothetical protein GCM10010207_38220 [Streptomyces atratus]